MGKQYAAVTYPDAVLALAARPSCSPVAKVRENGLVTRCRIKHTLVLQITGCQGPSPHVSDHGLCGQRLEKRPAVQVGDVVWHTVEAARDYDERPVFVRGRCSAA